MGKLIILEKKRRGKRIRRFIRRRLIPSLIIAGMLGLQIYVVLSLKGLI
jgi:hypothetical protein